MCIIYISTDERGETIIKLLTNKKEDSNGLEGLMASDKIEQPITLHQMQFLELNPNPQQVKGKTKHLNIQQEVSLVLNSPIINTSRLLNIKPKTYPKRREKGPPKGENPKNVG